MNKTNKLVFGISILVGFQNGLYAGDLVIEKKNLVKRKDFALENDFKRVWWLDEDHEEKLKQIERIKILKLQEEEIEGSRHSIKSVKKKLKILENIDTRIYNSSLQKRVGQLIRELQYGNRYELIDQQNRLRRKEQLLIELQKKQANLRQKLTQKIEVKDLELLNLQELEQLYKKLKDQFEGKSFENNIQYIDRPMVYYNPNEMPHNSVEANQISTKIDFVDETPVQIQIIENSAGEIPSGWEIRFTSNGRYFNFTMPFQGVNLMNAVMNKLKNVSAIRIRNTNAKQPSSAMVLWESDSDFNENCTIYTSQEDSETKSVPENNNSSNVSEELPNNIQKSEDKHALEEEHEQDVIENEQTTSSERSFAQNVIYHMVPYGTGERVLNVMEGEIKRFLEKNDSDMF